jgi:multidrug efflux pump subunit AcrB
MNFRNLSAWSIRNPVVPIVLFLGLTLAGLVSFMMMKVQDQPDIEFPMVIVTISQPGAAPTEIETQITQRIESAVRTIAGVDTITSTASEGSSQTMVQFKIGTDINGAVAEVKNAVDQVRGDLPDGILEPQVAKAETSSDPIAYWAVSADDMTIEQLSWFVDDTLAKRLLAIPGMAEVTRAGGVTREIAVTLDPMRMKSFGVTASQVNAALRAVNLNAAGGRAEVAGARQSVRVLGNAASAYALGKTQIAMPNGRVIRLSDVANVHDSYSEITSIAKFDGKPVVTFSIARARGESDVSVYDATIKELEKISAEQGHKIRFTQLFTSVDYTKQQYRTSISSMVEGAVLAVIVVFFFLRDWRATFVSAIAIPLSAIPTFAVMHLIGFTLNTMSLLALGLVAGVLVDDAIVEIENIVRHIRMGKTPYQAAIDAADEIGLAVVATTFSIVAVFLPVGLMPGISGQFFKNFGITVVVAVLFSLLVARMITPMIAAYFLKRDQRDIPHGEGPMMDRYMGVLRWSLDTSRAAAYRAAHPRRWLRARLRDHRLWMMGLGLLALVMTGAMFVLIPSQFFPDTDSDFSTINIEMVPGTTIEQTAAKTDEVYAIVKQQPEVAVALERIKEGSGRVIITLRKDRARTSMEFERALTLRLQQVADARVTFSDPNSNGGPGSGRAISVMLSGSDPDQLQRTAQVLVQQMSALKTVVAPRISADLRRPEIVITPTSTSPPRWGSPPRRSARRSASPPRARST